MTLSAILAHYRLAKTRPAGWGSTILRLPGRRGSRGGGRLVGRTAAVCFLLSAVVGSVFFLLVLAIGGLRDAGAQARHAQQVLVAASQLELLLVDVQTGARGYILTGQERFLKPWRAGQANFPGQAAALESLAAASGDDQGVHARRITRAASSYISDYSVPLVATARRDPAAARAAVASAEGERRLATLHVSFMRFETAERQLAADRQAEAEVTADRATTAAAVGVAGTIALILLSGGYLSRLVIRPVRRASLMAGQVAAGDLTVRMPATAPGEVGTLERAFNTMAGSLEASRDELSRIAAEQAALRRVATLVARGVPPPEVFGAVAAEAGRLLAAESTAVARYDPDAAVTVVGGWAGPGGQALPLESRWPVEEGGIPAEVLRTGEPAQRPACERVAGGMAAWARGQQIRSSMGSPVFVNGRLWGVIIAFSRDTGHPEGSEARMAAFTELVAMAVANTDSRAQLAASRARVVATADETRRRIERDLHDGIQQRLISLALELRSAAAAGGAPGREEEARQQWIRTGHGLTEVVDELREISRGLHPAILERGGLGPALRALARRCAVPVELSIDVSGRLPERVEVAAYYIVSEALTNVAKHAHASTAWVEASVTVGALRLVVRDDGSGGADPARGSGLIGLSDRVEALGGRIEIASPPGGGTSLLAVIPVRDA